MRRPTHILGFAALALLALIVAGCGVPGTISASGTLPAAAAPPTQAPLPAVRFPQDEAPHHDLTEWWYYTGHLYARDSAGHALTYGFELTFFQTLRGQFAPYYVAHFAISDVTGGQFHYDQRVAFEPMSAVPAPGSTNGFDVRIGDWSASGLNGHDELAANMTNYAMRLSLAGKKPAILHGGNGIITYGEAGFSYYYSRPLMTITGTLTDHGQPLAVTGQAWMDHQWGNFLSLAGAGWDWYSLQLNDNTEYMLYVIRDAQKRPISVVGTLVSPSGVASEIPADAINIQATGDWHSPHTGGDYPSGWRITVSSQRLSLVIAPLLRDQELVTTCSTGVAYWEGAIELRGTSGGATVAGVGYVELTGYAATPPNPSCAAP